MQLRQSLSRTLFSQQYTNSARNYLDYVGSEFAATTNSWSRVPIQSRV